MGSCYFLILIVQFLMLILMPIFVLAKVFKFVVKDLLYPCLKSCRYFASEGDGKRVISMVLLTGITVLVISLPIALIVCAVVIPW